MDVGKQIVAVVILLSYHLITNHVPLVYIIIYQS